MNREDIIRMAREAGFREPAPSDGCMGLAFDYRDGNDTGASLERFAALVAAAEREACAKVADASIPQHERFDDQRAAGNTSRAIAAAIRARGQA